MKTVYVLERQTLYQIEAMNLLYPLQIVLNMHNSNLDCNIAEHVLR